METCLQCGAITPTSNIEAHPYFGASKGCWAVYGTILAREYSDPLFFKHHRQTVDAYALQHPADDDPRAIQSVNIHLIALTLLYGLGLPPARIPKIMNDIVQKASQPNKAFKRLERPVSLGGITVSDIVNLTELQAHLEGVDRWARDVLKAWETYHDVAWEYIHAEDIK